MSQSWSPDCKTHCFCKTHSFQFDYLLTIACDMLGRTVLYSSGILLNTYFMNTSVLLHFEHKCNVTIMES